MGVDEFVAITLGLPEVTQNDRHPTLTGFRVRDKGFCYLNEADGTVMLKATREEQAALVAENPEVFAPSWAGGRFAWLQIDLAKADPEELTELVTEAWRLSAPKRLTSTLDDPPDKP
ncbi:MmcQ/YjbR family DNA-binding protein [Actinomadura sp. 7K507]|uniref:MmcQ/YjbR family DNA-binding protein n=1 Tax=Actinomadura sp. 7K507 TaxID=2530365 RepID=UPI001049A4A0|nr:MmcQ/YjbR family DNA-binding protein [Actinomadura sp. 7K507]TDC95721.1 MmcQ/YjbR family DNA-binding protein [Actinomadura sp. 7K507]